MSTRNQWALKYMQKEEPAETAYHRNPNSQERSYTVREACKIFAASRADMYRKIQSGELRSHKGHNDETRVLFWDLVNRYGFPIPKEKPAPVARQIVDKKPSDELMLLSMRLDVLEHKMKMLGV